MKRFLPIIAILLFTTAGFLFGYGLRDTMRGHLPDYSRLALLFVKDSNEREALEPVRAFTTVLGSINAAFYGDTDKEKILYAAIEGYLSALNDPYTELLKPSEAETFEERNKGRFTTTGGIGAELGRDPIGARIKRVFKNSPASMAGIQPDDVIVKVNGNSVSGRNLEDVVKEIRGEEGTKVTLTIFRETTQATMDLTLTRKKVSIQDVYADILNADYTIDKPKVGRLEVRSFSETITQQFDEELAWLENQGIKGLIIDLRGNPGGVLRSAVEMCSRFFERQLVTKMKRRDGTSEPYFAPSGNAKKRNYPIVILVDEGSASAAEIFAGALKDYKLATIVGEHTYGKAAVQQVWDLNGGARLKLTIGRYYLPNGESIARIQDNQGNYLSGGIKPDIEVKLEKGVSPGDISKDNQLRKAYEIIVEKIR